MIFISLRYAFFITLLSLCIATIALISSAVNTKTHVTENRNNDSQTGISPISGEDLKASQENHPIPTGEVDYDIPEIAEGSDETIDIHPLQDGATDARSEKTGPDKERSEEPAGLYSPVTGLGWSHYLNERLEAELRRSASFEQDLVLLISRVHYSEKPTIEELRESADSVIAFFTFRDLSFDWNDNGFALVLPNIDLEHGLKMADEYTRKFCNRSGEKGKEAIIRIGLSARAGRLVNAERLIMEAERALRRALEDDKSPIVAFKPDPERYRSYISSIT